MSVGLGSSLAARKRIPRRRLLRSLAAAAGVSLVGILGAASQTAGYSSNRVFLPLVNSDAEASGLGWGFLQRQYEPAVGLCREAPNAFPDRFWVYSDGYLAGLDVSRWSVSVLTKWRVVVERASVPEVTFAYQHKYLTLSTDPLIMSEAHDPEASLLPDWDQYADRVLLAALSARNAGDQRRFAELTDVARSWWDGRGLRDLFFRNEGVFQTYHVALYYLAVGEEAVREALLAQQERDPRSNRYGGVYTEYYEDGTRPAYTDVNVETTSVTLRALGWQ